MYQRVIQHYACLMEKFSCWQSCISSLVHRHVNKKQHTELDLLSEVIILLFTEALIDSAPELTQ